MNNQRLVTLLFTMALLMTIFMRVGCSSEGMPVMDTISDKGQDAASDKSLDTISTSEPVISFPTGLMWQRNSSDFIFGIYKAQEFCENLDLGGFTDWRLPTVDELRTLIVGCAATMTNGTCPAKQGCGDKQSCWSDSCAGCAENKGPGAHGCYLDQSFEEECGEQVGVPGGPIYFWQAWYWWSSTESPFYENWIVGFSSGAVGYGAGGYKVKCVRGLE